MPWINADELLEFLEEEKLQKKWGVVVRVVDKREAEDLTEYLVQNYFAARYFHDDIETLYRMDILTDFASGAINVLVAPDWEFFPIQQHQKEVSLLPKWVS